MLILAVMNKKVNNQVYGWSSEIIIIETKVFLTSLVSFVVLELQDLVRS